MSAFSVYHLTAGAILTQDQKVRDQTNTTERLGIKLKFDIKDRN